MILKGGVMTCAKKTTIAIITNGTKFYVGSNWCENPREVCPRTDNPVVENASDYTLCKTVCKQRGHAEVDACINAGENARGGTLYLIGHTYCCDSCKNTMANYGIMHTIIVRSKI